MLKLLGGTTIYIKDALKTASVCLSEVGISNSYSEAEVLLSVATERSRTDLYANFRYPLTSVEKATFKKLVFWRIQGFPLQYLAGTQTFRYLKLKITPGVFIPRPETELLVEQAIETIRNLPRTTQKAPSVKTGMNAFAFSRSETSQSHTRKGVVRGLPQPVTAIDLGTGSGAIALSLAYEIPAVHVYAVDISPKALELAAENAIFHNLRDRISFIQSDLFKNLGKELLERADLIVANPPYIPALTLNGLPIEVQREPRIALDGGSDGLIFYRRIIKDAPRYLKVSGYLVFEVGMGQAGPVTRLIKDAGAFEEIEIFKDYAGIERIIKAKKSVVDSR